jgi:diguanylate cyclase (GGDEF)-like protein
MLKNFSILYVEDDKETQERMQMILEEDVKIFYQAYNGEEGLKIYKEKQPDIILTDVNMPILDGLSMAKEIKNIDRSQPIIIMSAFDDREILLNAINIGIDYFTMKPVDIELLYDRLNQIAQNLQNKLDLEMFQKKELERLYDLAHYDTLTSIPNRFLFNKKLEEALSRAKRKESVLTLFFIDLDNFKAVNDSCGHAAGDRVLQEFASNIKQVIRLEDTLARISGDEFALIVEDVADREIIEKFVQKVILASHQSISCGDHLIKVSCSIGIGRFPYDATTKKELIHHADIAMYKAKSMGKSTYSFCG